VDFDWSPESWPSGSPLLGLEVEGVHKLGGEFDGVVVAQVITKTNTPRRQAYRLPRQRRQGERQIVCGAQNFKPGDKVPLSCRQDLPLSLAKGTVHHQVGKIRGSSRNGMMCSHEELGLEPEALGLKRRRAFNPAEGARSAAVAEYLGVPAPTWC